MRSIHISVFPHRVGSGDTRGIRQQNNPDPRNFVEHIDTWVEKLDTSSGNYHEII